MIKTKVLLLVGLALATGLACAVIGGPAATETPAPETPAPDPTSVDPNAIALRWTRVGGIAGFCDELTVTAGGIATAVSCADAAPTPAAPLDAVHLAQLQAWMSVYSAAHVEDSDDAVADSMTVTLDFYGFGDSAAGEADIRAMQAFAAEVFALLHASPTAVPPGGGPCLAVAVTDVDVYSRPDLAASLFGTLSAGESVSPTVQSVDGWLGFDPGVAQAGNVGVFRNRWVMPDDNLTVSGDCAGLPVAPVISPTACYSMAMFDTPVYSAPEASSSVVLTLSVEGFAAVAARNAAGWVQVDLNDSSQPLAADGWIEPAAVNFNGPCDTLPELPH